MLDLTIPVDVRQKEPGGALDFKAICIWAAFGFMLNNDTFFDNEKWDRPVIEPWYYRPSDLSFDQAVERYAKTFESVVGELVANKKILLALSGGIDSRTVAVALSRLGINPYAYSYKFQNSFDETQYGRKIAKAAGWDYDDYIIPEGYLWNNLDELGEINQCYTEFTHVRQAAVAKEIARKGDVFLLGHWGDVLFDDMHLPEKTTDDDLLDIVIK